MAVCTISGKGLWKGRAESTSDLLCLYIHLINIFFGCAMWQVGSQFLHQELMPSALEVLTARNLNHWTTREVPRNICLKNKNIYFPGSRYTDAHTHTHIYITESLCCIHETNTLQINYRSIKNRVFTPHIISISKQLLYAQVLVKTLLLQNLSKILQILQNCIILSENVFSVSHGRRLVLKRI